MARSLRRPASRFGCLLAVFLIALLTASTAHAQVSKMPAHVQDLLAEIGPVWGDDIRGNIERTYEVYAPLLRDAPKDGVRVTRDVSYGPHPNQELDVYQPENGTGAPIVVFIHGGAYVRGSRNRSGNVLTYFARQGMVGINADYRLAPGAPWPAGAEDMGAIVTWVKANGTIYGGDTNRIYFIGNSAGATHIAGYVLDESLQPDDGHGVAGVVLMSGRYRIAPEPNDPNFGNVQAYFGDDASQYPRRSPITHIDGNQDLPTFVVIAEYDNPDLDTHGAQLFAALCERDGACPRFTRMMGHNHLSMVFHFNTADDALGREILEFIKEGR